MRKRKKHKVAIFSYQNVSMFELGCAIELFAYPRPEFEHWYQGEVVAFSDSHISAAGKIKLEVQKINSFHNYDMLIIPSWDPFNPQLESELKKRVVSFYEQGGKLLSFCSGAFFIAECGLLNGRKATTHWQHADRFKFNYPESQFVENVLYIYQDRIGCSAGSAAAMDFGLEVIRQDFGHKIANQVARRLVMSPHRSGGQSQFVEAPIVQNHTFFSNTLDWAIKHLHKPISIEGMAQKAAMSRRSFDRHFRASLGMSPKEWLNRQRVKLAQRILESSPENIDQIAEQSGFNNAMNMRHHFRQYLSTSPSQYRSQFADRASRRKSD